MKFVSALAVLALVGVAGAQIGAILPQREKLPELFAPDSLWRRPVKDLAVSPNSDNQIEAVYGALLGGQVGVVNPVPLDSNPPSVTIELAGFLNPPIYTGSNLTITVPQEDYNGDQLGPNVTVPLPRTIFIVPTGPKALEFSVGQAVLITEDGREATDMYQTTTYQLQGVNKGGGYLGPILAVGEVHKWDLNGPGDRPAKSVLPNAPSMTRLPLLAGMLLPEDIQRGVIQHVLSVTFPQFRNQVTYFRNTDTVEPSDYYAPCQSGISLGTSWRRNALGSCQVLRLKPEGTLVDIENKTIDETKFTPLTRMVLRAYRAYGIMPTTVGPSMSLITESLVTGFLNVTEDELQVLLGGRPVSPQLSYWYQALLLLARELSEIPVASASQEDSIFSLLAPDTLRMESANWEVVVGQPGDTDIGESFIDGYNYNGSIDVVLVILACCFFVPVAGICGYLLINRQAETESMDQQKDAIISHSADLKSIDMEDLSPRGPQ